MSTYYYYFLLFLAFAAGSLMPVQGGINGQLANTLGGTLAAACISFLVGTVLLLVITFSVGQGSAFLSLGKLQWWHWIGGILGAFFVTTMAFAGPKVGALLFMVLMLAGQLSSATFLDHFGLVGFHENPISLNKIIGLICILGGVFFIQRG